MYVPSLEASFEFYIPINKKIGTIKNTLIEFIQNEYGFAIKDTGSVLIEDIFVYDSNIRNGTKILLI